MTTNRTNAARALVTQAKMGGPGLRTFYNISQEWGLTAEEQMVLLGSIPSSTFYYWKKQVTGGGDISLSRDTLERISYVLGIYKSLRILLPGSYATWVKRPNANPLFGGRPALERMLSGNMSDLITVRQFLDAWRGGWA